MFYSPAELVQKPRFMVNLLASMALVVIVTVSFALILKQNIIYINPTAEIKFVHRNPDSVPRIATINAVSEEIGTEATLYGYFGSLMEICSDRMFITRKMNDFITTMRPVTVVIYPDDNHGIGTKATIGTMTFSDNTCKLANNIHGEEIYVLSDVPFQGLSSGNVQQFFRVSEASK